MSVHHEMQSDANEHDREQKGPTQLGLAKRYSHVAMLNGDVSGVNETCGLFGGIGGKYFRNALQDWNADGEKDETRK